MGTQHHRNDDVIELTEEIDPATGESVFGLPDSGRLSAQRIKGGALAAAEADEAAPGITLPGARFAAGFGDEFEQIQRAQDQGMAPRIVNGRIVLDGAAAGEEAPSIELTDKRFAAYSGPEAQAVRTLISSGAAARYVQNLQPTSDRRDLFPRDPGGVYLHTRPTRLGDELHTVIRHDPATGLYHAHLWSFVVNEDGRRKVADLNRWVGTPGMSAHRVHLWPGRGGEAAVICLSPETRGGMPTLDECVVRCAQWATGMGEVVRGRPFPYRE